MATATGYINQCGRINLNTGMNLYFNILEDWTEDAHLVLFRHQNGTMRVVGGAGQYEAGRRFQLFVAQYNRRIGAAEVVKTLPCTLDSLQEIKQDLGGDNSVLFSTWD